ncbi:MAG: threonine/serine exporter family protein, partial [Bacteroidales bacterium]|nr:threonine/serine exporter family protein [Bacteroidales bacterium]
GTLIASTIVAFISRFFAVHLKCPGTVFLICGAFPLIPGAGVFWSSYYVVSEQMRASLDAGFLAVKITIAIVLGIIIAANVFRWKKIL